MKHNPPTHIARTLAAAMGFCLAMAACTDNHELPATPPGGAETDPDTPVSLTLSLATPGSNTRADGDTDALTPAQIAARPAAGEITTETEFITDFGPTRSTRAGATQSTLDVMLPAATRTEHQRLFYKGSIANNTGANGKWQYLANPTDREATDLPQLYMKDLTANATRAALALSWNWVNERSIGDFIYAATLRTDAGQYDFGLRHATAKVSILLKDAAGNAIPKEAVAEVRVQAANLSRWEDTSDPTRAGWYYCPPTAEGNSTWEATGILPADFIPDEQSIAYVEAYDPDPNEAVMSWMTQQKNQLPVLAYASGSNNELMAYAAGWNGEDPDGSGGNTGGTATDAIPGLWNVLIPPTDFTRYGTTDDDTAGPDAGSSPAAKACIIVRLADGGTDANGNPLPGGTYRIALTDIRLTAADATTGGRLARLCSNQHLLLRLTLDRRQGLSATTAAIGSWMLDEVDLGSAGEGDLNEELMVKHATYDPDAGFTVNTADGLLLLNRLAANTLTDADRAELAKTGIADLDNFEILQTNITLAADIRLPQPTGGETSNWTPIGKDASNAYTATFDGGGHIIKNLTIVRDNLPYIGLFGYLGSGAKVQNLKLEGGGVKDENRYASYVGAFAGYADGGATIENCHNLNVKISSTSSWVGGIAGLNNDNATISHCTNAGIVSSTSGHAGGIAGSNNSATITACISTGAVSDDAYKGGIVGYNYSSSITHCFWQAGTGTASAAIGTSNGSGSMSSTSGNFFFTAIGPGSADTGDAESHNNVSWAIACGIAGAPDLGISNALTLNAAIEKLAPGCPYRFVLNTPENLTLPGLLPSADLDKETYPDDNSSEFGLQRPAADFLGRLPLRLAGPAPAETK